MYRPAMFILTLYSCCLIGAAADRAEGPVTVCEYTAPVLKELSGLACSRRFPGVYYAHNDSGGAPEVYALDRSGNLRTTIVLKGARNVDWEDIAIAPGAAAGEWDLLVGDIGDNHCKRNDVRLYRFPEPRELPDGGRIEVAPVALPLIYPDGPHNAEALGVHPNTGAIYVFTKREDGESDIFRLPPAPETQPATQPAKAIHAGRLGRPDARPLDTMVTSADFSPDGRCFIIRSYTAAWEWRLPASDVTAEIERALGEKPSPFEVAAERQGEGIAYSADGASVLTISEGNPTALHETRRMGAVRVAP